MESKEKLWQRQSLLEMMRRRRRDPEDDLPFDDDGDPDGEIEKSPEREL